MVKTIVMAVYDFLPDDMRVLKEAMYLASNGYKISVFCLNNGKKRRINYMKNLQFLRIQTVNSDHNRESIINLFRFWITSFFISTRYRPDIFYVHDPTALPGIGTAAFILNKKLIYDSHELFAENAKFVRGYFAYILVSAVETIFSFKIDGLISVSQFITDYLSDKFKIRKKISLPNFPDSKAIKNLESKVNDKNTSSLEKFKIIYPGSIVPNRGYHELVETIKELNVDNNLYEIRVVGSGPLLKELIKAKNEHNLDTLIITGPKPYEQYLNEIRDAHLGLILFKGLLYQRFSAPVKAYEFLHADLPMLIRKNMFNPIKYNLNLNRIDLEKIVIWDEDKYSLSDLLASLINEFHNSKDSKLYNQKYRTKTKLETNWDNKVELILNLLD